MKRFVTIFLTLALLAGLLAIPAGATNTALDTAAKKAAAFAVSELPHPGAADDWAVISVVIGQRGKQMIACHVRRVFSDGS